HTRSKRDWSSDVCSSDLARYTFDVLANEAGYVSHIVANEIGAAAMMLGAGRETKDSKIDLSVGVQLHKKVGEFVEKGDIICSLYANTENTTKVKEKISENIIISNEMPKKEQ